MNAIMTTAAISIATTSILALVCILQHIKIKVLKQELKREREK